MNKGDVSNYIKFQKEYDAQQIDQNKNKKKIPD